LLSTNLYYSNDRADSRINAQKGSANGIPELDVHSQILFSRLPTMVIKGILSEYTGSETSIHISTDKSITFDPSDDPLVNNYILIDNSITKRIVLETDRLILGRGGNVDTDDARMAFIQITNSGDEQIILNSRFVKIGDYLDDGNNNTRVELDDTNSIIKFYSLNGYTHNDKRVSLYLMYMIIVQTNMIFIQNQLFIIHFHKHHHGHIQV